MVYIRHLVEVDTSHCFNVWISWFKSEKLRSDISGPRKLTKFTSRVGIFLQRYILQKQQNINYHQCLQVLRTICIIWKDNTRQVMRNIASMAVLDCICSLKQISNLRDIQCATTFHNCGTIFLKCIYIVCHLYTIITLYLIRRH